MSSDRAPPERPDQSDSAESIDEERADTGGLSAILTRPGPRRTSNVSMLVTEAELVAEGHEPDNPAQPKSRETADAFHEAIEDTDLVPAWTRPWEDDDADRGDA